MACTFCEIFELDFIVQQKTAKLQSMGKKIEIFRTGTHTAMSGDRLEFSEEVLGAAAAAYDPAVHEAPLVVGHPKHDDPAYGWVAALSSRGESLFAEPTQVDPAFQEWVDQGRYKKISASFYHPTSAQNPVPGTYYLRHVGFLGAMPPAIKGMKPIEFAEEEKGVVTIEFGGSEEKMNAVDKKQTDLEKMNAVDKKQTDLEKRQTDLENREKALALRERAITLKEQELQFSEALDEIVKSGRIPIAQKAAHLKRLKMLAAIPSDNVADFAEGKPDYSPTQEYLDELKARPEVVNFNEISGGKIPDLSNDPKKHAAAIERKRKEAAKSGRILSFAEADAEVRYEQNGGNK